MSNSNKRKSEFLGMPHGTAANKLKKNILFSLLVHIDMHHCYVCGDEIGSADDLSIEHIEPWLDRENGVELFWDLENIAFSHKTCNRPHTKRNGKSYIAEEAPEGTAWCSKHQDYLPVDEFSPNRQRNNGYRSMCRDCNNTYERNRRKLGSTAELENRPDL